jgi:hypothetical protein
MSDDKDKAPAEKPAEKPQLPPSKMREAVDSRRKTSGATVARRQAKQNPKKK